MVNYWEELCIYIEALWVDFYVNTVDRKVCDGDDSNSVYGLSDY